MLQDDCVDLFIQHFSFWEHLSDQEKELLCDNTIAAHYPKGISVHSGNEDCIGILLVKKGQLRTYLLSEDGRDVTLYRLFEGDVCILSASCVLDAITFDVFIDAEEDTDVSDVASMMLDHDIKQIPVVKGSKMIGMITRADIVRLLAIDK